MPLTPEERRTYDELKARHHKEQRIISRIIRYWVVTIVVVIVVGAAVDAVSGPEAKELYQRFDEQFLESLRQVNLLHIFNVYFDFVTYRTPPVCDQSDILHCPFGFGGERCDVRCEPARSLHPLFLFLRPLFGLGYTASTIAEESPLNIWLFGLAALLSVIAAAGIFGNTASDTQALLFLALALPAMTFGLLSILFPLAWLVKIVFGGLVHLLIVPPSGGFIGALLLKATEHHFSAKAIRRLAKEAG